MITKIQKFSIVTALGLAALSLGLAEAQDSPENTTVMPRMGHGGMGMGPGMMRGKGMGRGMGMMGSQIPADNPVTPEKVDLGKQLYYDPRLSKDGTVSCNSCHDLNVSGADKGPVSTGVGGLKGTRNAPTVWNSSFHRAQFWDGRAKSLEEQAKGPLVNPVEMAMPDFTAVENRIKAIPGYVTEFEKVFGKDSVNIDNIARAIATFERTLINNNSKFDNFRFIDKSALTDEEWQGFKTFRQTGCRQCHMGPDFAGPPPLARGNGFYQKFPKFPDNSYVSKYKLLDDNGRYNTSHEESDRHVYRVPTLRNVAETAPYFHNGSVATLNEAVRVCGKVANNQELTQTQAGSISLFLETLTGKFPKESPPDLPR